MASRDRAYARSVYDDPRWRALRRLFQASGLPCWLCGFPIQLGLPRGSKWGWTLDHRVPLAEIQLRGLDPFDRNNLAPAHRSCNSRKGIQMNPPRPRRVVRHSRDW